jgi:hypothetical protein
MELLDRYLQAVKFWLPKAQKQDIIEELSEDIRSQIEEKEIELGRKLNEAEGEAILKQRGRPVLVANRYSPQQYLIGPVLFPIYRFVLKIVALCYLVPWVLVWMGFMIFDPGYRAQHSGGALIGTLASLWGPLWLTAFFAFGAVTIVFAVLERAQAKSRFLEDWDPRKLPAVRDPNQISRASSIFELVANTVFCVWWIEMRSPVVLGQSAVRITLAPVWPYFFWGFLLLALANIATSGVNLFRPYWTRVRASMRLATDVIGAALFCWLCKSEILAGISVATVAPARTVEITNAINLWMSRGFPIAVAIGVIVAAFDIRRIIRAKTPDTRLTGGVAAGGWPTSAVS